MRQAIERAAMQFRQAPENFQIFWTTNWSHQGYKLTVTGHHLKIAKIIAGILGLVICLIVVDYARLNRESFSLTSLRKENKAHKKHLEELYIRMTSIENQIHSAQRLNQKLTWIVGKSTDPQKVIPAQYSFLQDPNVDIYNSWNSERELPIEETMTSEGSLENRISLAENSMISAEARLLGLMDQIYEKRHLLGILPSIMPVPGWISSRFGYRSDPFTLEREFHYGIDIGGYEGMHVKATGGGTVKFAGIKPGYGRVVVLDHGYGLKTLYAHCTELLVERGERIQRGQVIAKLGSTGRSTGPHVHYEIRLNDQPVNPTRFILENL